MEESSGPAFLRYGGRPVEEHQSLALDVDLDRFAFLEFSCEDLNRERVLDQSLDRPLQRPGAEDRVVTLVGDQRFGAVGHVQAYPAPGEVGAPPSWMSTMVSISSRPRRLNAMISSIRFRSSV